MVNMPEAYLQTQTTPSSHLALRACVQMVTGNAYLIWKLVFVEYENNIH